MTLSSKCFWQNDWVIHRHTMHKCGNGKRSSHTWKWFTAPWRPLAGKSPISQWEQQLAADKALFGCLTLAEQGSKSNWSVTHHRLLTDLLVTDQLPGVFWECINDGCWLTLVWNCSGTLLWPLCEFAEISADILLVARWLYLYHKCNFCVTRVYIDSWNSFVYCPDCTIFGT